MNLSAALSSEAVQLPSLAILTIEGASILGLVDVESEEALTQGEDIFLR